MEMDVRERERERAHTKCRCVVFEIDAAWQMQTDLHCAAVDRLFDSWEH